LTQSAIAIAAATGCHACETTILDIHHGINDLTRWAEIRFWPYLLGSDPANLGSAGRLDVAFFTGAIATDADRALAVALRAASDRLVAVGACAAFGGLPGLRNIAPGLAETSEVSKTLETSEVSAGQPPLPDALALPPPEPAVRSLDAVVPVDAYVPGCPVPENLLWAALSACIPDGIADSRVSFAAARLPEEITRPILSGNGPPPGATFAGEKAVCASCSRVKEEKRFTDVKRPHQAYDAAGRCLLEQGLICDGIATREGCGGLCTGVGVPCRGCYGKAPAAYDPGAKMVSAISSTFETERPDEIQRIADRFVDMTGTFYRYTLPAQCMLLGGGRDLTP
jgi:F420-non-reducing hydrogenase small subunit